MFTPNASSKSAAPDLDEDAWLAAWSKVEASVNHPIDPFTLAQTVADLLRTGSLTSA